MTWAGDIPSTDTQNFSLSALDSAQVSEQLGWDAFLPHNTSAKDVVLLLNLTARSLKSGTAYADDNFWIPLYSSNATLVDPGLELTYLGDLKWKVTATAGVGADVWFTEPARVVGFFDNNAVFLGKGEERVFDFTVQQGPG